MLTDKVLFVTGGGSGIGQATALAASREGALLAIADQQLPSAEAAAQLIRAEGRRAVAISADVSDAADVARAVQRVVAEYGRLDCAFNNAGIAQWQVGAAGQRLGDISEQSWARIVAVNLTGAWLCLKAELEQMLRQGHGSIVNTASVAGLIGVAGSGAYVATKHALIGLTKTAALEYAGGNIRINCVCPGLIDTPLAQSVIAANGPKIIESVPLRRLGMADEVAQMVLWLFSDRASFVTGAAIPVDGGVMAS